LRGLGKDLQEVHIEIRRLAFTIYSEWSLTGDCSSCTLTGPSAIASAPAGGLCAAFDIGWVIGAKTSVRGTTTTATGGGLDANSRNAIGGAGSV